MAIHQNTPEDRGPDLHEPTLLSRTGSEVLGFPAYDGDSRTTERLVWPAPAFIEDSRDFEEVDNRLLRDRIVLVVEGAGGELYAALRGLARAATDLHRVTRFQQAAQMVWDEIEADYLIIVDIDVFDMMSEAIETLRLFRLTHPLTTVVIASAHFTRHDLSAERRVIADASVRIPSGCAGIALAIGRAIENNRNTVRLV